MELTIKNLRTIALTDESAPFSATVYVDGKRAFNVSDDGHGGCYMYDVIAPALFKQVQTYAASLPKKEFLGMELDVTVDDLVGDAINISQNERNFAKVIRRKQAKNILCFTLPADEKYSYRTIKGYQNKQDPARKFLDDKYGKGNYTVL